MSKCNLPEPLSAKYKGTFAYETVKDRMPVILTKAIDTCYKQTTPFRERYGEPGAEDVKSVVGKLSKQRSELMTDKPFIELDDDLSDASKWNEGLNELKCRQKEKPSPFTSPWLFTECMMYRKISGFLQKSNFMKSFDPFRPQKEVALQNALPGTCMMAEHLQQFSSCEEKKQADTILTYFKTFLKASLWSNRFDLSLSAGEHRDHESHNTVAILEGLDDFMLTDDSDKIFQHLYDARKRNNAKICVDLVVDNAGFEICSDLILAEFLLRSKMADCIQFHVKNMPWFVSDVTFEDFHSTLLVLASQDTILSTYSKLWDSRLNDGTFVLTSKNLTEYWTLPFPYCEMQARDPELYHHLKSSSLIIFKGDMNFRKLVGDLAWSSETSFVASLQGFHPAPLCSLRTLKADVVVGLESNKAFYASQRDKDWMVSGKYATILSHLSV